MKDEELLVEVKKGLKELSDYNDDEIMIFINAVVEFMRSAGVTNIDKSTIGVITLGVDALRLRENFSDTFRMLVTQLRER